MRAELLTTAVVTFPVSHSEKTSLLEEDEKKSHNALVSSGDDGECWHRHECSPSVPLIRLEQLETMGASV